LIQKSLRPAAANSVGICRQGLILKSKDWAEDQSNGSRAQLRCSSLQPQVADCRQESWQHGTQIPFAHSPKFKVFLHPAATGSPQADMA
jgi:hypothetical protein